MNNKITKKRLGEMFSYDWIKMLCFFIAIIIGWSFLFNVFGASLLEGQEFDIFYDPSISATSSMIDKVYQDVENDDTFSYDVLSYGVTTVTEDYYSTYMSTRVAIGMGDIYVCSKSLACVSEDDDGQTIEYSEFDLFVDNYSVYVIDELLNDCFVYIAELSNITFTEVNQEFINASLDEALVKEEFVSTKKKDYRFKTDAQIEEGVLLEIEKLENYKANALDLYNLLARLDEEYGGMEFNPLRYNYTKYTVVAFNNPDTYLEAYEEEESQTYGIDLGFLEDSSIAKDYIGNYFRVNDLVEEDEDEEDSSTATSKNVVMSVFDYYSIQGALQFETISFLTTIIRTYSTLLD